MENPIGDKLWRKSSYSGNGGNCVEVAPWHVSSYSGNGGDCAERPRVVLVRDTKDRDGGALEFTSAAWSAFTKTL
jgi:hypothetical protein